MHPRSLGRRAPIAIAQAIAMPDVRLPLAPAWDVDGVVKMLFRTKGRVSRKSYRIARLGVAAGYFGVYLFVMLARTAMTNVSPGQLLAELVTVVLAMSLILWCDVAITIKRWHDLGKPAWWALLGLVPIVGWLGQSVVCMSKNGTPGINRYGPSVG